MIKGFKSNIPAVYAFVIIFVGVASAEIFKVTKIEKYDFYNWYISSLQAIKEAPLFDYLLTVIAIMLTGYFINRAINKTTFFTKKTALPLFIFVAFLSTWDGFYFETAYVIDLLFALSFLKLIELDQNKTAIHIGFVVGILFGIGFLFSYWVLPLAILLFFSLLTFRPFIGREWFVSLLGMALPVLYLFSFRYLFLNSYVISPVVLTKTVSERYWYDYLSYSILVLIVLIALFQLSKQLYSMSNVEKKQVNILMFFLSLTFLLSFGAYWLYSVEYFIFTVPLALLISIVVLNSKQERLFSILFAGLLGLNLLRIFLFS